MSAPNEREHVQSILKSLARPYVVELGACDGDDTEWLWKSVCDQWLIEFQRADAARSRHEPLQYLMVEPDPRNILLLHRRFVDRPALKLVTAAISDHPGTTKMWLCDNKEGQALGSSSILEPTLHKTAIPWCTFPAETEVPTLTLDDLLKFYELPRIDLLWVDIQGAERKMIAGGGLALAVTRYLFIEVEDQAMYDGQATRRELYDLLGPGWRVLREFEYNTLLWNKSMPAATL